MPVQRRPGEIMPSHVQIQAIFVYVDDLLRAVRAIKQRQLTVVSVHSPVQNPEITALMAEGPSPVRYITLAGAILGIVTGFGLSVFTAMQWRFVVSGKPPVPAMPYVIEAFEFCILFAVLSNVMGLLLLSRLPRLTLPASYDPRVTEDRFSVLVGCPAEEQENIRRLLQENGAEEANVVS